MNKNIACFIVFCAFFSCNKPPQPLTKAEINQKADSITRILIDQSNKQARTDLDYRIKIEVKVKADSIFNAHMRAAADTGRKAKKNIKPTLPVRHQMNRVGNI